MNKQSHIRTTFIGEAYLPSYETISSLVPILLHDLRLETHHRGRILIARTFCEPVRLSAIQNGIEDIHGNVDRLSIYNLPSKTPFDRVLPKSAIVAVKEPYFKAAADGGVMVRVDHPSDFVLLNPDDSLVPPQWRRKTSKASMSGSQMKIEGNKAFKQGDWQQAGELYGEALAKTADNTDLRLTLHRNRAQVHLNLGQYELALDDAIASIAVGDGRSHQNKILNVKSYFRAGRAQYELANFTLAKQYFDQAMGIDPTDEAVLADLARTQQRILEQQKGDFDFAAMAKSATLSHRKLDHATFTNNTTVAPAGKRGRGLFATDFIKRGSLVLVEKAFCVVFEEEVGKDCSLLLNVNTDRAEFGTHAERLYNTTDKIRRNPHHASKFLELYDGGSFKGKKLSRVDGAVIVDAFQVQAIAEMNGFGCPKVRSSLGEKEKDVNQSTGIWVQASYMNHSCLHNTICAFIGDMMIVRATDDINAGEEIFASYKPAEMPYPKRKEKLAQWGFQCDCRLCQLERQLPASVFTNREQLVQEANEFIAANPRTSANLGQPVATDKIAKAKDILRRLEATYDKHMYKTFPRLDCVSIDLWLVQAGLSAFGAGMSPTLDIATTSRLLQDLGFKLIVKGSEASIERTNGVVCEQVVHAAMYGRQAWNLAGKPHVALTLLELAKEVYLGINGAMDGFDEKFGDL